MRFPVAHAAVVTEQVTEYVLFHLTHRPLPAASQTECFPPRLPQTVIHDSLEWSHSWVTAEHLAALTRRQKAAQFILTHIG